MGGAYTFFRAETPERFIKEQISVLRRLPPPVKNVSGDLTLPQNPDRMQRRFADGSWAIFECRCESSGDRFSAAVLVTSNGSALFTLEDVDGYESFSICMREAKNDTDMKRKLLSSGRWHEWGQ